MLVARVIRRLWSLLDPRRRWFFVGLVGLMFVTGVLEMGGMVVLFGFTRGLVADANGDRHGPVARLLFHLMGRLDDLNYVVFGGVVVVGALLTKNLLSILVQFGLNRFIMKLNERVSRQLLEGYLLARYDVFTRRGVSGPSKNISRIFDLFSACFGAASQVMSDAAVLCMVALLLFWVDFWMTLIGILIFGVVGIGLYFLSQRALERMSEREKETKKVATSALSDGFQGVVDSRLNNTRSLFVSRYVSALSVSSLIRRRRLLLARLPQSLNEVLLALTIVLAVLYMTLRGRSLIDALPTLAIFAFAGLRLTGAMSRVNKGLQTIRYKIDEFSYFDAAMSEVAPQLVYGNRSATSIDQYLADEEPLPAGVDGRLHQELRLENVEFRYPDAQTNAIDGVSLTIPRGSFVSFCGASGGGKSTLVLLLMGMLKPQSGDVLCDGRSVFRHIRAFHSGIGYVGQRMFLSSGSVRENVAFGLKTDEIDDAQVWRALELASAVEFVRGLPDGLDTPLKEAGSILSGGQRQRISIARALYKDPEIIFFDEATAALDNITEREITSAINRLSGEKTIVCVAHRLSTIQGSDVIHMVEQGRVIASGSYEQLTESSSEFRELALTSSRHDS